MEHQNRANNKWFGLKKASKKITETGLINEISHVSEAGENQFIRPVLLKKQGAHDKENSKTGLIIGGKSLESMKKEKRLITKAGLVIGDLASKTRQQITTTGLRNGIRHESEAGKIHFSGLIC